MPFDPDEDEPELEELEPLEPSELDPELPELELELEPEPELDPPDLPPPPPPPPLRFSSSLYGRGSSDAIRSVASRSEMSRMLGIEAVDTRDVPKYKKAASDRKRMVLM